MSVVKLCDKCDDIQCQCWRIRGEKFGALIAGFIAFFLAWSVGKAMFEIAHSGQKKTDSVAAEPVEVEVNEALNTTKEKVDHE